MYRHVVKSAFWLAILTFSNLGHSKRVTADARIPKQFIIEIEKVCSPLEALAPV